MTDSIAIQTAEPVVGPDVHAQEIVQCQGNAFVTRIRLVDGRVDEAWSTGRMMRNMNMLLRGELDERGRPGFVSQAHCLCNDGHALAAIRAVEDLAGVGLPDSAILVRKLVQSMRCMQEHLLHFYQFHFSDWVSLEAALRVDPAKAASMASLPGEDTAYFRSVQDQLRLMVEDRSTTSSYTEDEGRYQGPDALHLLLHGHALASIQIGASLQAALGLLECGPKGFKAYRIGGLPDDLDLSTATLEQLGMILEECREFIGTIFPADLARLARVYSPWTELGRGSSFLTWDGAVACGLLVAGGGLPWRLLQPDSAVIREECEPDWNHEDSHRYRLFAGRSEPLFRWGDGNYFWLSAPRHGNSACEVGPLARVMGGLLNGQGGMEQIVSRVLDDGGLSLEALNSTMGRVLSRGIEASVLMDSILEGVDELECTLVDEGRHNVDFTLPTAGIGVGRVEVPRGTLTHTIRWGQGRIMSHDYLIPSLWNFSPRDARGELGPLERALRGTPVINPDSPVEILRTLHEFDPCNTCHVVIENRDTGRTTLTTA
ncbi:hydrogenase 2 large subunit [Pseudodesulfovibrio nedwellii]|uniref:Hydrogenase 2 large subunit n=1 Tax=Pseudodesulfovibrio nedwellii TaxID=2973072 RepID=A0ABN6S511_9BACT|nr:nickel-dependent hydrogenase large subunit [Pseudodesulfovibrio nedwellii]BDQ37081.1 hydrogenase 2 large subunit [Pseudodesulfovibrio nedwellii]